MKTTLLSVFIVFCFLTNAKAYNKTVGIDTTTNKPKIENNGSSYEKAIIILEKTEGAGETAEYDWIKKHYPGSRVHSQSLIFHEKKSYDIINITTADGMAVAIYFDISNFYGKF